MSLSVSLIVPTRERAAYLPHCVRTCTENPEPDLEILVLDNASTDNTSQVAAAFRDPRIRYVRNEYRLSMRDNFEKGLELASGDIVCFIGDDDGVLPGSVARALQLFESEDIDAISAARAHYFWPDLVSARRNTALLPRHSGIELRDAKSMLLKVLDHSDYYRLPCLYHGFVRRTVVERVKQRQGRFFLSSQVDMYSSIALSMEGIKYAFSKSPLVINGGSSRSNGASHFGGGSDKEKLLWKQEDELGFLPGFDAAATVGSLIVESALRYCEGNGNLDVFAILGREGIENALASEAFERLTSGRSSSEVAQMFATTGIQQPSSVGKETADAAGAKGAARVTRLAKSFAATRPINMASYGVHNVFEASQHLDEILVAGRTGFGYRPWEQIAAAFRLARR